MFAIEEKYGIIRKKYHMYTKADFMSALRTLTEEEKKKIIDLVVTKVEGA